MISQVMYNSKGVMIKNIRDLTKILLP